jgi:hypothetical protein
MMSEPVLILAIPASRAGEDARLLRLMWFGGCAFCWGSSIRSFHPRRALVRSEYRVRDCGSWLEFPSDTRVATSCMRSFARACGVMCGASASLNHPRVYATQQRMSSRSETAVLTRLARTRGRDLHTRELVAVAGYHLRSNSNVRWSREVPLRGAAAGVVLASPDMEPSLQKKVYDGPRLGSANCI